MDLKRTLLSAIVIGVIVGLMHPIGAGAAGSLMTIVDANSDAKAQVEGGKLRIGDGDDLVTTDGRTVQLLSVTRSFNCSEAEDTITRTIDLRAYSTVRIFLFNHSSSDGEALADITSVTTNINVPIQLTGLAAGTSRHTLYEALGTRLHLSFGCSLSVEAGSVEMDVVVWGRT